MKPKVGLLIVDMREGGDTFTDEIWDLDIGNGETINDLAAQSTSGCVPFAHIFCMLRQHKFKCSFDRSAKRKQSLGFRAKIQILSCLP